MWFSTAFLCVALAALQSVAAGGILEPRHINAARRMPRIAPDVKLSSSDYSHIAHDLKKLALQLQNFSDHVTGAISALEHRIEHLEALVKSQSPPAVMSSLLAPPPGSGECSTATQPILLPTKDTTTLVATMTTTQVVVQTVSTVTRTRRPRSSHLAPSSSAEPISQPVSQSTTIPAPVVSNPPASGSFDPNARNNLAVYYGQTPDTTATGLGTLCEDPDVDIVVMAFVYNFFGEGGYPSASFGPGCSGQTAAQAKYAPGLSNCHVLASQIQQCQARGKKVLVSLGGAISTSVISSPAQAVELASTLWGLFGGGKAKHAGLRPFGDVIVDGFDIDNENNQPANYNVLVKALRKHYATDSSKQYYISAAPQCPHPDASISESVVYHCDFVWVQFYNNYCNIGTSFFADSFQTWSQDLATNVPAPGPKLYIGGAASSGSAGSGYIAPDQLRAALQPALSQHVSNLGGIMFWDGTNGLNNVDASGQNYLAVAKAAISS